MTHTTKTKRWATGLAMVLAMGLSAVASFDAFAGDKGRHDPRHDNRSHYQDRDRHDRNDRHGDRRASGVVGPRAAQAWENASPRAIFKRMDLNGDGRLSQHEIDTYAAARGAYPHPRRFRQDARSRFNLDLDGDGVVSRDEHAIHRARSNRYLDERTRATPRFIPEHLRDKDFHERNKHKGKHQGKHKKGKGHGGH